MIGDERSRPNPLRAFSLSRESERRRDTAWLARQRRGARVVPVYGDAFPFSKRDGTLRVAGARGPQESLIFLGHDGRRAWFARDAGEDARAGPRGTTLWDLRRAGLHLDSATAGLLAYAKALCHWHRRNRFCGRCGSRTVSSDGGHRRHCSNEACALESFPRLDPAIIVRVTLGGRVLLGRQPRWLERRFSVLAGFVEPAESLEDAVHREVTEEAGLALSDIRYHSSQPWPFPASLMLGFTAEAADDRVCPGAELASLRWYGREALADALRCDELRLPMKHSISFRLLADWYDRDGDSLEALVDAAGGHAG